MITFSENFGLGKEKRVGKEFLLSGIIEWDMNYFIPHIKKLAFIEGIREIFS